MQPLDAWAATALDSVDSEILDRFYADPLEAMRVGLGLNVEEAKHLTQERADGGACDGMSFVDDGVILYAHSASSKRENFTLAHELGHWLLRRVPEVYDWLSDQPEPKRSEETLCDVIAQRLLVPDSAIDAVVQDGPVRAQHVVALFDTGNASLPVCAIALAQRIPGLGAVIVTRRDPATGEPVVEYASIHPDPTDGWPEVYPWPGQEVPAGHPIKQVRVGSVKTQKTSWTTSWGKTEEFYLDAVATPHDRVVGVLAANDIWGTEKFHPTVRREYDQKPTREVTCCGTTTTVRGWPCGVCGTIACPQCGYCRHQKQENALVPCERCCMAYRSSLLIDGLCEDCR